MTENEGDLLTVTDLKQYTYCPRVTYYERCLPDFRPRTHKMDEGKLAHEEEQKRAARRRLRGYGLERGERRFEVALTSARLRLRGKIDEVVVTPGPPRAVYPVDYKLARQASPHYQLQLVAYALMLEEAWGLPVERGYIYLIPVRRVEPVAVTPALRAAVFETLKSIEAIVAFERMPSPPARRSRCASCEFRRACNDL